MHILVMIVLVLAAIATVLLMAWIHNKGRENE